MFFFADMDRSTSSAATNSNTTGESFSPAQLAEIRQDLEVIMHAHLDITDDKVAELLQFFNKAVNSILSGNTCDPKSIDIVLLNRFHLQVIFFQCVETVVHNNNWLHVLPLCFYLSSFLSQPPVYNADPQAYDRALEAYIGLNASTHELTQTEVENRMHRNYTIQVRKQQFFILFSVYILLIPCAFSAGYLCSQFQDFTCVNLKDYKVCVVVRNVFLHVPRVLSSVGEFVCGIYLTNYFQIISSLPPTARVVCEHHAAVVDPGVQHGGQRADPLEGHPALRARQGELCTVGAHRLWFWFSHKLCCSISFCMYNN